ncbi:hypothetical protein L3X38_042829 [Prunus dulcis]|uniref:Uncharacterized protein n=1 Tax=Prunus dulcis TaxID=3755 RepID=A0AAD4UVX0_PRUDU|nr:hypothetical protein L3X38_042829 [Prunus dulcis]
MIGILFFSQTNAQFNSQLETSYLNHIGIVYNLNDLPTFVLALRVEDVKKLVNDRLRDLKVGGDLEDALSKEVDQVSSTEAVLDSFLHTIQQGLQILRAISSTLGVI